VLDSRLIETVSRTLGVDAASVNADMGPANTPAWDSVAHLTLILEIEAAFDTRFPGEEIPKLISVGLIQEALAGGKSRGTR
jgi:acyl carrier protein